MIDYLDYSKRRGYEERIKNLFYRVILETYNSGGMTALESLYRKFERITNFLKKENNLPQRRVFNLTKEDLEKILE